MAIYMAPFLVNARKFDILHFSDEPRTRKTYEYVCPVPTIGKVSLLNFLSNLRGTSTLSTNEDAYMRLQSIAETENSPCDENAQRPEYRHYTMRFLPDGNFNPDAVISSLNIYRSVDSNKNNHVNIDYLPNGGYTRLEIDAIMEKDAKEYMTTLVYNLVPSADYYNFVLDFGSEASQGMLSQRSQDHNPVPLNFIDLAKKHIEKDYAGCKDNQFHQYTGENEQHSKLFKSMFFVVDKTTQFLSLVEKDDELRNRGKLLPNLKVSLLYNLQDNVMTQYRGLVMNFIRCAISGLNSKNNIPDSPLRSRGLQLNLLVPNVMPALTIDRLKKELSVCFESLKNEPDYADYFLEITTYSESDAAFVYCLEKNFGPQMNVNKNYLMIDGGKGTMDFSLIHVVNARDFRSLYRDGFVGSGNTLTYALFDHLCTVIIGDIDNLKRKKLMERLLFENVDQYSLYKVLEQLESIKTSKPDPALAAINCKKLHETFKDKTDEFSLEAFASHLKNNPGDYGDEYGIIHGTCTIIVQMLVKGLLKNKITSPHMPESAHKWISGNKGAGIYFDEVIMAGRAFRHPVLMDTFKAYMRKYFGLEDDKIRYETQSAKISCMYGAINMDCYVNSNCGLSGIPAKSTVLADEDDANPEENRTDSFLLNLLYKDKKHKLDPTSPLGNFSIDETFLNEGYNMKLSENERLHLNGHILAAETNIDGEEFNLYYTGSELTLRNQGNVTTLKRTADPYFADSLLMFESRFPMYDESDRNQLSVFKFPG